MVVALDTNVAIDFLRGDKNIINKVLSFDKIYLPITVCGELIFGAINSSKKDQNIKKTQQFINSCETLNINNIVAEQYANIRVHLKNKGKPIPENDIWIAAVCSSNNIPLLSNDKHFKNISNIFLKRVN